MSPLYIAHRNQIYQFTDSSPFYCSKLFFTQHRISYLINQRPLSRSNLLELETKAAETAEADMLRQQCVLQTHFKQQLMLYCNHLILYIMIRENHLDTDVLACLAKIFLPLRVLK